jgi:hypothetical protein
MKHIAIISVILLTISCKSKFVAEPVIINQKVIDSVYTIEKLEEQQSISQAIFDSMYIKINEVQTLNKICDSLCNQQIDYLLSQINYRKKSGDNEYSILYNKYQKQIEMVAQMKERKSVHTNKESVKEKIKIQYVEKPVDRPVYINVLKKWQKIMIGLGFAFMALIGYRIYRFFLKTM